MPNSVIIEKKINKFNKVIKVSGDKSISIRWVLVSSLASGISKATNLLMSEDVIASIQAIKKLGVKVIVKNDICKIYGVGINGYKYKKNIIILNIIFLFPLFIAISGREVSLPLFDSLIFLGPDLCRGRLRDALEVLAISGKERKRLDKALDQLQLSD